MTVGSVHVSPSLKLLEMSNSVVFNAVHALCVA